MRRRSQPADFFTRAPPPALLRRSARCSPSTPPTSKPAVCAASPASLEPDHPRPSLWPAPSVLRAQYPRRPITARRSHARAAPRPLSAAALLAARPFARCQRGRRPQRSARTHTHTHAWPTLARAQHAAPTPSRPAQVPPACDACHSAPAPDAWHLRPPGLFCCSWPSVRPPRPPTSRFSSELARPAVWSRAMRLIAADTLPALLCSTPQPAQHASVPRAVLSSIFLLLSESLPSRTSASARPSRTGSAAAPRAPCGG